MAHQMTERTSPGGVAYLVDGYGFPVSACPRCAGTGRTAFTWVDGGRCFGCAGGGVKGLRGKVGELRTTFLATVQDAKHVVAADMQPGMRVRALTAAGHTPEPWREVKRTKRTARITGSCTVGAGDNAVTTYNLEYLIFFTDGTYERLDGNQRWRRERDMPALRKLRAEVSAEARRLHEATLDRRAARQVKAAAK